MGSSQVNPYKINTLWSSLESQQRKYGTKLLYAQGYDAYQFTDVDDQTIDHTLLAEAVCAAQQASVSIVMVGLPGGYESEALDRSNINLPAQHNGCLR